MSLLLDALKKAAEDKKKASNNGEGIVSVKADVVEKNASELKIQNDTSSEKNRDQSKARSEKEISKVELTLDEKLETTVSERASKKEVIQLQENHAESKTAEAGHSISDDALSLLIYKTNSEEKKRKRIFAIGTTMAILSVIGIGGAYYYFNLQEGIDSLELKHRTAMMRMESKTNKQRPPEKTEIIDNLTANSEIKVEKKVVAVEVKAIENKPLPKKKNRTNVRDKVTEKKARLLLIEKTKQADIIGEKLEAAFGAYEKGRYTEAKNLYHDVVLVEKNNRDALLGLAAISVVEKDAPVAKKYYSKLLKLDPNDPIAVAALANLRSNEVTSKSSEKYLVSMLEKTPESAQLSFELGNVFAKQNNWAAAQESYFKAWQQESDNPDYIFNLAVSLDQLGQQKQAMSFYKDSLLKATDRHVSFSREIVEQRLIELSGL